MSQTDEHAMSDGVSDVPGPSEEGSDTGGTGGGDGERKVPRPTRVPAPRFGKSLNSGSDQGKPAGKPFGKPFGKPGGKFTKGGAGASSSGKAFGKPSGPRSFGGMSGAGGSGGGPSLGGFKKRGVGHGPSRGSNEGYASGGFGGERDAKRGGRDAGSHAMLGPGAKLVHEDLDLLIVDKPVGMVTAAGPEELRETLFDFVKAYVRSTLGRPTSRSRARDLAAVDGHDANKPFAGIIHRLDAEASGLLVFTKNEKAYHWLKDDFKSKRVHRIYLVLVEGTLGKIGEQGTIQSFLREARDGTVASIKPDEFRGGGGQQTGFGEEHDQARPAVTHYKVLAQGGGCSLLQVRLETGRKHQIRAHMCEKGHPIVGDRRYGSRVDPIRRLGLHAVELGFTHPSTGESVRFKSDAPSGFYTTVGQKVPTAKEPLGPPRGAPNAPPRDVDDTSWQNVAGWYDQMISEKRSDHYDKVIIPGTIRLVQPREGMRALDVACGQGVIARELAGLGASVVGVDAAESLITAAKQRSRGSDITYHVADAKALEKLKLEAGSFDAATCVMALANINPLEPLLSQVAALLKPGGRFVFTITHPAFRAADQTGWGWDEAKRQQYRRVDGYLSLGQKAIQMHPGSAPDVVTWTFHRPLQTYIRLLAEAGLAVDALEEWPAMRVSEPGPRADEENRARREIPLFLAIRAVKR